MLTRIDLSNMSYQVRASTAREIRTFDMR